MRAWKSLVVAASGSLLVAACAVSPAPVAGVNVPSEQLGSETIAWSVGPCFGFCPVYTVAINPAGSVTFEGERHTEMLGRQAREGGPAAWRSVAAAFAAYRPSTGATAETTCERKVSDQPAYRITWTAPDGRVTTLIHSKGCQSFRNDALNAALQSLPTALGIEPWARQRTRPDASRG